MLTYLHHCLLLTILFLHPHWFKNAAEHLSGGFLDRMTKQKRKDGCFPNRFIKINAIGTGGLAIKRKAHSEALRARTCSESATPRFGGEPYIKPRFLTRKMKNIFEFIGSFFGGFVGSFFSAFFSFLLGFINGLLGLFFGLFF